MTTPMAATIKGAQHARCLLLAEWGLSDSERRAADAVTILMRYGLRPTAARLALPVPRTRGAADPDVAHRGAAHARRLLAARRQECR